MFKFKFKYKYEIQLTSSTAIFTKKTELEMKTLIIIKVIIFPVLLSILIYFIIVHLYFTTDVEDKYFYAIIQYKYIRNPMPAIHASHKYFFRQLLLPDSSSSSAHPNSAS